MSIERTLLRGIYKKSFYDFVKAFWHCADPSKFIDGKLIQLYCETFQYMCRHWVDYEEKKINVPKMDNNTDVIDVRQEKNNICIMVPPRHTKSMIFNVFGPVWLWLSYPIKAVSISHTAALATQMNEKRYSIINSDEFKYYFPEIHLTINSKTFLKEERGGELYSINRNAFTGYGGDIIINDDLTNAESARKDKEEMANAWSYYQNTMPSRINDPKKCIIMNIQQRLAPNDIAGHIMKDKALSNTYVFVTLPAIFKKETYVVLPISGEILHFKKGDYLWKERFGDYKALQYQVGNTIFETQYLQNPIASDRTIIKPEMIIEKNLTETPGIENSDIIYASHDFPIKDKDTSDFLGSVLAYRVNSTIYIVDCLEKRMAFTQSVDYVERLDGLYNGAIQIIEDKANGSPILQQLQDKISGLQAYQPGTASKTQRLESASLYLNSGNVVFVKTKFNKFTNSYEFSDSVKNLIEKLTSFPFVEHDDIVDAFSMLILFVYMDRRFMVYGRSFNENNIYYGDISVDTSTIYFNREGDIWKACEIGVKYGEDTKLYLMREIKFKADIDTATNKLKEFAKNKSVVIDCSDSPALSGAFINGVTCERYVTEDFDKSVSDLNLAFAKKAILINNNCSYSKADIENFKFSKTKDETIKYMTDKDGFVSCIRTALHYNGGIIY